MTRDELLDKLIPALRSGKYRQARGSLLAHNGARCCVGLAAKIMGLSVWVSYGDDDDDDHPNHDAYNAVRKIGLPVEAMVTLNDIKRLTFPEIADWLEEWRSKQ